MTTYTHHPKRVKNCVFCKFWIGDAKMRFRDSNAGYEYQSGAQGKCTKRNGVVTVAYYSCSSYVPSPEAEKLL